MDHYRIVGEASALPLFAYNIPGSTNVTITPELPKLPIITGMILRPEFRWDTAVNGVTPFDRGLNYNGNGQSRSQGMFNMDVIVPFSLL